MAGAYDVNISVSDAANRASPGHGSPRPGDSDHAPADLGRVLATHRIVVCVGSGGVGKTTTSAALAVHAAASGRRVLCLTIDPAKRLAQSLGLTEIRGSEQSVAPELFAQYGLPLRGSLSAMMLDMKHTFDDLVAGQASSPEQRDRILGNRLYQYVSTSLAGTQEYMAMEKLHAVRHDERFDLIVLDTPPTTNALDFLDAPQKLVGAIDSPVMRWFVETLEGAKGLSLMGRGAAFVLKGLGRFTGMEFLQNVGQFVTELNSLFGGFRERARSVYETLKSKDVAFVIVTSPSPLTVPEAIYFTRKLREYGIEPKAMVVNRVHAAPDIDASEAELRAQLTEFLSARHMSADPGALLPRLQRATEDAVTMAHHDMQGLKRLRKSVGDDLPYVEVPAFDRDVHELGSLARLSEYLVSTA